jgi:hypothetical protein
LSDSKKFTIDAVVKDFLTAAEIKTSEVRPKNEESSGYLTIRVGQNDYMKATIGNSNIVNQANVILVSNQLLLSVIEDIVIFRVDSWNHRIYEEEYTALRLWSSTPSREE